MNKGPTMLSELIKELSILLEKNGDMPVAINGYADVYSSPEPYYYDGGAMLPMGTSKNQGTNWEKSRNHGKTYPSICHLSSLEPEENDTVNGEDLPTSAQFTQAFELKTGLEELCKLQQDQIKKGWRK